MNKGFFIAFLLLESLILGCFLSINLVLFYMFFEAITIPLFFIIGIWGGNNRLYACYKFFLFTLFGSFCFLLSLFYIHIKLGTFDLMQIPSLDILHAPWVWIGIFVALAIKIPVWPFHSWLPDAHVEAPTTGSVMLAGVLLKVGGYGLIRILWSRWPEMTLSFAPLMQTLGLVGILYASFVAFAQKDIKKIIAYSSVAHMGYTLLGIASGTSQGIRGAIIQMMSHGLISAGLFFCVGILYERFRTRNIEELGGLKQAMPRFTLCFFLLTLGAIAVPGTSGFVGEFLVILGTMKKHKLVAGIAATGMVFTAVYMLNLYRKVFLGKCEKTKLQDVNFYEIIVLSTLVLGMGVLGVFLII